MKLRDNRPTLVWGTLLTGVLIAVVTAGATGGSVHRLQAISGRLPEEVACPPDTRNADAEWSPTVAVNPADPNNLIAAWVQGEVPAGPDPRSPGIVVAASTNGGVSWTPVAVPGISGCSAVHVVNEHVSIGPDGRAYLVSLGNFGTTLPVRVNTSLGGFSWSGPTEVVRAGADYPTIAAEPDMAEAASVVWSGQPTFVNAPILFSRTTDGGTRWSPPVLVHAAPPGYVRFANVAALDDGTLLVAFVEGPSSVDPTRCLTTCTMRVVWSEDKGKTWSQPVTLANTNPFLDVPAVAAGPDGTAYIAWREEIPDTELVRIMWAKTAKTDDSRRSWQIGRNPVADNIPTGGSTAIRFLALSVAISEEGTVGVLYDDARNDDPKDKECERNSSGDRECRAILTTDVWLAHSHDGGATWEDTHVAGPFDRAEIPAELALLGVYQGLTGLANGFGAVFAQSGKPPALEGAMDIFYAQVRVPKGR